MLKRGEVAKKQEISSKEFTKRFIKNFLINGIIIGIIIALIYELIDKFVTNSIVKEIMYFGVVFFTINVIYVAAIKDIFYDSYIEGDDIRKSKNNVIIVFIVLALIAIINDVNTMKKATSILPFFKDLYLKVLIIKSIINVVLYAITIALCRDEIDKRTDVAYENKNIYLIKHIVLIVVFALVVILGMIYINHSDKNSGEANKNINITINNETNENKNTNITISNDTNENKTTEENQINKAHKEIKKIYVSVSNELIVDNLANSFVQEENVKKYYAKSEDGKVEINISTFDTGIDASNSLYNIKMVEDGVIIFYVKDGKNLIEKFDMNGNSNWKLELSSEYVFYNEFVEVVDGYFLLGIKGTIDSYSGVSVNGKTDPFIFKIDKHGNFVSSIFAEKVYNISFVKSETNNQKGYLECIGINSEGNNVIIKYNNKVQQEELLYTELSNIKCGKVIEKNGYYYGFGSDSTENLGQEKLIFKINNTGKRMFLNNVKENYDFHSTENEKKYVAVNDIAVNEHSVILLINDFGGVSLYQLDLDGNLQKEICFDEYRNANLNIDNIICVDNQLYVGNTEPYKEDVISEISTNLEDEYKIKIKIPKFDKISENPTVNGFSKYEFEKNMYYKILYKDSYVAILQYRFE